jgi:hypothetical protein
MAAISVTVISGTDNDLLANENAFRKAYLAYIANRDVEEDNISSAVHALFDRFPTANLNVPYIETQVATALNALPENHAAITKKVGEWLRANNQGKKLEDGSYERPDSAFVTTKGVRGGVRRRSDML